MNTSLFFIKSLKSFPRFKKIVATFAKYGFREWIFKLRLQKWIPSPFISKEYKNASASVRLRVCLESLGPSFIKLGQILSQRTDLFPKIFTDELSLLQSHVSFIPLEDIEPIIVKHLGSVDMFKSFDKTPLAAGSIAQTYSAVLKTGESVVVKVRKPDVCKIFKEDGEILLIIAKLLEKYVKESRPYAPVRFAQQFIKQCHLELDLMVEANNIRRFRENFKSSEEVIIPQVYHNYSSILVMDKIEGVRLNQDNVKGQIDVAKSLDIIFRSYLKMLFHDGFYHGDLHLGNIFILPDGKVAFIDFGIVGRLNKRTQMSIAQMFLALEQEDYDHFAMEYLSLMNAPILDTGEFTTYVRDLVAPYYGLSLEHTRFGSLFIESSELSQKYQFVIPSDMVVFMRSVMSLEGLGRFLSQNFDFLTSAKKFVKEFLDKGYGTTYRDFLINQVLRDSRAALLEFPKQVHFFLNRLNDPRSSFSLSVKELKELKTATHFLAISIFLGFLILSLTLFFKI